MSDRLKTLVFAVVMCIVCSILLTTASRGLQRFQEKNILMDMRRNILKSVNLVKEGVPYSYGEIEKLFTDNIQPIWVDPSGRQVEENRRSEQDFRLYLYTQNGSATAYIVPINSRGLWGKIHGYLAIESDGSTVSGFTVYKHSETPGLGGEIEKQWFQNNWVGKKIVDQAGQFVSIGIAKGAVTDKIPPAKQMNYVDGISGATLTGKYLSAGIRQILQQYEPVSISFRSRPKADSTSRSKAANPD
ncbi:MAG: NADH:ubiquinone oxidoreductase subunit C [Deltaproteobacteria bacterium SG8_13]|nr:MAG: NADH:ubiquinone oxidoreductase subunit C [Deltaproteobacteria bacterium SG8_13]